MIKAIIFDMDGVITDSEHVHKKTIDEMLASYGAKRTPEVVLNVIGMPGRDEWAIYKKLYPQINDSLQAIEQKRREIFQKHLGEVTILPGFTQLFSEIGTANLKRALTTSSSRFYVTRMLPQAIVSEFQVIITNQDVKHCKPHPEPYRKTVEQLGLDPSECVVIEDALHGIASAKAAGCHCIAITTSFPKERLQTQSPDYIISSLQEINVMKVQQLFR